MPRSRRKRSEVASPPAKSKSKIFKIKNNKPDYVRKAHQKDKFQPKNVVKQSSTWLKQNLGWILAVILAVVCIGFLIAMLILYLDQKENDQFYEDLQSKNGTLMQEIELKKELIGTKKQLETEIINYQSAPNDLREFVLHDYAVFKGKCIVNGQFIGPTTYDIINVVYDSYAKIKMNCEGEDAQILAKVGGRWSVVHSGQAAPNCNDVNSLDIPQGVAPTCTDGKILYPNPNP